MIQAPPIDVRVRGLTKRFGAIEAVRGIDFEVGRGEIFGLIGPDGAGKTTTFNVLAGILKPTAGEISLLGERARTARTNVGYLTQQFSLFADLSVDENLAYIAGLRDVRAGAFQERSRRYLALMNLGGIGDRLAGQLSGGMKQRLGLCCALISEPRVLLNDEPTVGVDPLSRREFWSHSETGNSGRQPRGLPGSELGNGVCAASFTERAPSGLEIEPAMKQFDSLDAPGGFQLPIQLH